MDIMVSVRMGIKVDPATKSKSGSKTKKPGYASGRNSYVPTYHYIRKYETKTRITWLTWILDLIS